MGTKIFVIKLRELIKTVVFAVLGLAILGFIISLIIPNGEKEARYEDGTFSSAIILHNNPVEVQVRLEDNEIAEIKLLNMGETQEVFYPLFDDAMEEVAEQIILNQTTDITPSEEFQVTGSILIDAVDKALAQAVID